MKLKEIFYLQKSDRKVVIFLLLLVVLCIAGTFLIGRLETKTPITAADSLASDEPTKQTSYFADEQFAAPESHTELFPFDPNTADSTSLRRLGLSKFQIRNIYKYRAKGGTYRSSMDFAKLYGLTRKQFRSLEPYIRIGEDYLPAATLPQVVAYKEKRSEEARRAYEEFKQNDNYKPYRKYDRDTLRFPVKIRPGQHIDLATADTSMLKKVPGIGSGWARAIVNYRKRLGGYVAVSQLREIRGFPEETLPYFEIRSQRIEKINVNRLTVSQLRSHPYINFYQAKAIWDYRRLKGPLTSLSQLSLLSSFPADAIARLNPYVTF